MNQWAWLNDSYTNQFVSTSTTDFIPCLIFGKLRLPINDEYKIQKWAWLNKTFIN
jgi:hypothetical protein